MNSSIYNQRLLTLLISLYKAPEPPIPVMHNVLIQWQQDHLDVFYQCRFNVRIFDVLLDEFKDDWYQDDQFGQPHLRNQPRYGLSHGFMFYFGLSHPSEFIHLFDTRGRYQNLQRWGGKYLNRFSVPSDYAFNIYEYLKRT